MFLSSICRTLWSTYMTASGTWTCSAPSSSYCIAHIVPVASSIRTWSTATVMSVPGTARPRSGATAAAMSDSLTGCDMVRSQARSRKGPARGSSAGTSWPSCSDRNPAVGMSVVRSIPVGRPSVPACRRGRPWRCCRRLRRERAAPIPPALASSTSTPSRRPHRRWRSRCCGCCGSGSATPSGRRPGRGCAP